MKLCCACATEKGNYRKQNQDAVIVKKFERKGSIFAMTAVFDGIGGLEHSELASALLAEKIGQWFDGISRWVNPPKMDPDILFSHFRDEAEYLNEQVIRLQASLGICTGSTMSALLLVDDRYSIIHVGDSRVYKFHDTLQQLTLDDTVTRQTENGSRNFLSNYMGKAEELLFSEYRGVAKEEDCFVVCSDGFYHKFSEEDAERLADTKTEDELDSEVRVLVQEMILRGERDNISAGAVCLRSSRGHTIFSSKKKKPKREKMNVLQVRDTSRFNRNPVSLTP